MQRRNGLILPISKLVPIDENQITYRLGVRRMSAQQVLWPLLLVLPMLSACAAASKAGDLAAKPLEYLGLIESSEEEAEASARVTKNRKDASQRAAIRHVDFAVSAGSNLNASESNAGLALVVRIYLLRDATAFQQAPFETFTNEEREAAVLGADVVSVRELILTPEQKLQTRQEVTTEVNSLGIVGLFRAPAVHRWRLLFDLKQAAREGVVLGANACALSVTAGLTGLDPEGQPWRLLPPRCP